MYYAIQFKKKEGRNVMKKKQSKSPAGRDKTLYYRATYETSSGNQEQEVFISGSMETARAYATGPNARKRQLISLEEFNQFIESLI